MERQWLEKHGEPRTGASGVAQWYMGCHAWRLPPSPVLWVLALSLLKLANSPFYPQLVYGVNVCRLPFFTAVTRKYRCTIAVGSLVGRCTGMGTLVLDPSLNMAVTVIWYSVQPYKADPLSAFFDF